MNARQAIQPSTTPNVLSVSCSTTGRRFAVGLSDGFRTFRIDNCLVAHQPDPPVDCAATIAETLDDRYCAFVSKYPSKNAGRNVVCFWDGVLGRVLNSFDMKEPILGLRLTSKWMAVILQERTVLFQYQELKPEARSSIPQDDNKSDQAELESEEPARAPNLAHSIYPTSTNTYAVAALSNELLVLPAQTIGQVQLVTLGNDTGKTRTKRVLKAHNSSLRCIALSPDGSLLATTSQQGTLVRVYSTRTTDRIAEFRRGMDHSIIYSLAFSTGNRFVASTSDKGTLHVFDLKPNDPATPAIHAADRGVKEQAHKRHPSYAHHRLSAGGGYDQDSLSGISVGRSSPAPSTAIGGGPGTYHGGSVQEYYHLRPIPAAAVPPAQDGAFGAMAALKAAPFMPQAVRDVRSVASAPFYTGNEKPHWQGRAPHTETTTPGGSKMKVKMEVLPLPNDPSGKPPKGIITFAPTSKDATDDSGAVIYVIGGGSDARWEKFELVQSSSGDGTWRLINRGFRRYLTRQFTD